MEQQFTVVPGQAQQQSTVYVVTPEVVTTSPRVEEVGKLQHREMIPSSSGLQAVQPSSPSIISAAGTEETVPVVIREEWRSIHTQQVQLPEGQPPRLEMERREWEKRDVPLSAQEQRPGGQLPLPLPMESRSMTRQEEFREDFLSFLIKDHREIESMFSWWERAPLDQRDDLKRNIIKKLVQHSFLEREVLYPSTRKLPRIDSHKIAKEFLDEHHDVELKLDIINSHCCSTDMQLINEHMMSVISETRAHMRHEEEFLFPLLRSAIASDFWIEEGRDINMLLKLAPTRPHPLTPSRPPLSTVAGIAAGMVDKMVVGVKERLHVV